MRLILGCGNKPDKRPGSMNHDRTKFAEWVDVAHDLNDTPWPWRDNQFAEIVAEDVLEHLDDFITFFDECWRILEPGGMVLVRVPRWDSINVHIDPTHRRGYHPQSFDYLDPTTHWGKLYNMYTPRKWEVLNVWDGDNITARLRVVKNA